MCTSVTNAGASGAGRRAGLALHAAAWLLALGPCGAAAAGSGAYGWPVRSGAGVLYPWYFNAAGCLPGTVCAGLPWQDRRPIRRPAAPDQPTFDEQQDIWGTTGSPWGYVRRLPPPTPESQIQPRYRDASTIRPEFDKP